MPNAELLANIRRDLETERDSVKQQLAELGFGEQDDTGLEYDHNFADTSQVTAEKGENAALAATLREHLAEVEHALEKIETGTYGVCESCGEQIAEARLEAIPSGRLCLNCASGAAGNN